MRTIKPSELDSMLAGRVLPLCDHLLPNGRKNGNFWEVGSAQGECGKSMKVYLNGKGWCDFAEGGGGDYLSLWSEVRGLGFAETIFEVKSWLGVEEPERKKIYKRPEKSKTITPPKNDVVEYLNGRGIGNGVIKAYKIEQGTTTAGKPAMVFPFYRKNELLQIKTLGIERPNGKKVISVEADCEKSLFGWQALPDRKLPYIVICEGEIDCLTFAQYGIASLSVPFGGGDKGKQDWIENEYPFLAQFEMIIIAMDEDESGRTAAKDIAERLGIDRCKVAKLPFNDCNECLARGVTKEQIRHCLATAKYLDREEIKSPIDIRDSIIERMTGTRERRGFDTPWDKVNKDFILGFSELTILNGVNGHGKSDVANQMALEVGFSGNPAMILSMELANDILGERLVRQSTGSKNPPPEYIHEAISQMHEKIWLVETKATGKQKAQVILDLLEYAFRRYNIRLFVIDSLMKCGIAEDDYNGQKDFVDKLCDFKTRTKTHVILVTHSRKGESEEKPTGKMDVRGSSAIIDLADNIIIAWRNKKWEELNKKVLANIELTPDEREKHEKQSAVRLDLVKNRNGATEGKYGLFFANNQFLEYSTQPIRRYVKQPMRATA